VFSPLDNTLDQDIENKLAAHAPDYEKLSVFTTNESLNVVKKLHPIKVPGIESITTLMIQQLPPEGLQILLHIYNSILRLDYWPFTLKQEKVIIVPKPGKNPNEVSSYRPISLLTVLSKILQKLLLIKITNEPLSTDWMPWHKSRKLSTLAAGSKQTWRQGQ
jgi:hypothetical protein